jgi:adenosylhomocysteine nucleosidase
MASSLLINDISADLRPNAASITVFIWAGVCQKANMPKNILLIAALSEEADAFHPDQGAIIHIEPHPMRVIEQASGQIEIVTCGLGKVNAALAVGRYADADTVLIAMTGTCGRIADIAGDTFWIARAIQHDYGALGGEGITQCRAGDWPMGETRDTAFTAMPDPGSGLPQASIISGDVFLNAQLVDMEVAAVAQAAEVLGLPWCAIKAVTDGADGESAGDFNANLERAARKAAEAMERAVELAAKW